MNKPIYIGTGQYVEWEGLSHNANGELITSVSSMKFTLYSKSGTPVTGAQDISMTLVPGSNATYRGILTAAAAANLVEGERYYLEPQVSIPDFEPAKRRVWYVAQYHGSR